MGRKRKNKKGASLFLTMLIMSAILAIAMGISKLSLGEIKISRELPRSFIAYYAAESGMEYLLYQDHLGLVPDPFFYEDCLSGCSTDAEVSYVVSASEVSPNRKLQSDGRYKKTRRAIELIY